MYSVPHAVHFDSFLWLSERFVEQCDEKRRA